MIAKAFSHLVLNRLSASRCVRTQPKQGAFRRGSGCIDQIFIHRSMLEHRRKFHRPTAAGLIDFFAAFDSIGRGGSWKVMLEHGDSSKLSRRLPNG